MNKSSVLRIVAVLLLAGISSFLIRGLFIASTSAPPPPAKAEIQVAMAALPVGVLLKADDLTWKEVLASDVVKGQIVKGSSTEKRLLGAVVRRSIDEGAPLTEKDVVFPDAPGFLAAALQPDMRAVSVAIDDVTGNAGLILPGDRVDLVLTMNLGGATDSGDNSKIASETILSGVRVIAVGSVLRAPEADSAPSRPVGGAVARTVTLEVVPRDGEKITVAGRMGQLTLALRSLAVNRRDVANSPAESSEPVWAQDVSQAVRDHTVSADPIPVADASPVVPSAPAMPVVYRGSKADGPH